MKKEVTRFLVYSYFVVFGFQYGFLVVSGSCLSYQKRYQERLKNLPQDEKDKLFLDNAKRNIDGSLDQNLLELFNAGADISKGEIHHRTVLHEVVIAGCVSSVAFLLKYGAQCNAQDYYKCSPLHYAANKCDIASARLLLSNGANKKLKNKLGRTPEQEAKLSGYGAKIGLFLEVLSQHESVD